MKSFDWIAERRELERLVDELVDSGAYALDTEFHRERTYLPQLALIQLATRGRLALVDALAVDAVMSDLTVSTSGESDEEELILGLEDALAELLFASSEKALSGE